MDGMSLLIVIALTWWLTGRYYKKKFGIKTIQVIEKPDVEEEETLATQAYRRHKARRKVEFEDD